jgi:hypothetical protein
VLAPDQRKVLGFESQCPEVYFHSQTQGTSIDVRGNHG